MSSNKIAPFFSLTSWLIATPLIYQVVLIKYDTTKTTSHSTPAVACQSAKQLKTEHRYTICHATASEKNPYVTITVDYHSIIKQGHDQYQDGGDIIPAIPEHNYPGKNLDKAHILENGCKLTTSSEPTNPADPVDPVDPAKPGKPENPKVNKPESPKKDKEKSKKDHKITVCHATRSATNPYVMVNVDYNSIVKQGHGSHEGIVVSNTAEADFVKKAGKHWGDIIPAIPEHNYKGLNYNEKGKQVLENDCKAISTASPERKQPENPGQGQGDTESKAPTTPEAPSDKPHVEVKAEEVTPTQLPITGPSLTIALILLASLAITGVTYLGSYIRTVLRR